MTAGCLTEAMAREVTDSVDVSNGETVNVAFGQADKRDLMGAVSTVNVAELLEKDYHTGATDDLNAIIGGYSGTIWGQWPLIIIDGIPDEKLIKEYNYYKDSIVIWINDQGPVADTLRMRLTYMKTDDSLNILVPQTDTIRMVRPKAKMVENRWGEMVEEVDTLAAYEVDATPENIDQNGIIITFESPMIVTPFDSITIMAKNTREQVSPAQFTVEQDTANIKKFTLRLAEKLTPGFEYTLRIPDSVFMDIDGIYCDSLVKKITLPQDESLSSLTVEASNVHEKYLVELVDEKRTKVFRSYQIDTVSVLEFPYLKAGKYSIRITEDKNGNGQVDTGSLLDKKQPEKVMMFRFNESMGNNAYILELPERTELIQTIDIGEMFK